MSHQPLHDLAERAGIARDWTDANGKPQQVSDDVLRKVLAGLGHAADDDAAVDASLRALDEHARTHALPPLMTVTEGESIALGHAFADLPVRIEREDGIVHDASTDARGHVSLDLPVGYHQLSVEQHALTLAVAPVRCYGLQDAVEPPPRCWGIAVQLYSLRRENGCGYGDCQALEHLVRSAAERGADAVAISPIHALSTAEQRHFSPYSPSSRLLLNTLYASPALLLGEHAVQTAIESCGLSSTLRTLETESLVDWPAAAEARLQVLRALHKDFISEQAQGQDVDKRGLRQDFEAFRQEAGQALELHCRFEVLQAHAMAQGHGADWRRWPAEWQDPAGPAVEKVTSEQPQELDFHAFCQWLTERSLQRVQQVACEGKMAVGLIADLAVGADGGGSQAWSRQDELLADLTVGAPPDILNRTGQDWGISAFSPDGLKRNGFRAFIEMLQANFRHAGGLRIDHVMGLRRLWLIPGGSKPHEGAYVELPVQDMLRLLALESHRHKAIVLGEDLGTVPEGLREDLAEKAILGMRVLQFEQDPPGRFLPIEQWPDDALATTGTHDLPTMAGWLQGRDIDWQKELGLIDEAKEKEWRASRQVELTGLHSSLEREYGPLQDNDTMIDAAIRYIGHTQAPLVLLPLEDLLGNEEQPNLPGTTEGHPNWRRRFDAKVSEVLDDPHAARRLEIIAQSREQAWERDQ
ncbi:4-alpha-glucanotransferase [Pseudomonas entomophila]|uniref:4-alpha-glucanotransferase n=1 Tax=Pseudomonas entomophila TaxID=312306 RepID=UPI0015E45B53|nr:4-alpha-glucanotransferase [Pseudomonas entomophila]MBA1189359.1 4-alpha-glucanotransferase [Pseudomonas entomophila]